MGFNGLILFSKRDPQQKGFTWEIKAFFPFRSGSDKYKSLKDLNNSESLKRQYYYE